VGRLKTLGLVLAALAVVVAMVWCCRIVIKGDAALDAASFPHTRRKVFKRRLAEGLRISRDGYYGVHLVKCNSCRLEKRKSGALTMGGLNVLVLEGLEVTVPPRGDDTPDRDEMKGETDTGKKGETDASEVVESLGVSREFLSSRGMPYRFSGVKISDLSIFRLEQAEDSSRDRAEFRSVKALTAGSGEAVQGGIELRNCRIFGHDDEEGTKVRKAKLVLEGKSLRLVWRDGAMNLN